MAPPVTNGLIAHYDASEITASDGDSLSQWNDQSGNNNDLSQSSSGLQPTYRTNSFPTGLAAADFDSDYMTDSGGFSFGDSPDVTMFVAVEATGWTGNNPGLWRSDGNSDGNEFMIFQGSSGRPWVRWDGSDILKPSSGYEVPLDDPLVQTWRVTDESSVEFFVDGSLKHSDTHAASPSSLDIYNLFVQDFDRDEHVDGLYGEALFYNRALTDSERSDVESYLLDKWINSGTAISAQPVTLTASAQGPTVNVARIVSAQPVTSTVAAQAANVTTVSGVAVQGQPASLTVSSQVANVALGALAVSGQPAGITISAQVAKVSAGTIDITGQPALLTTAAQAATTALGALAVSAQTASSSVSAQAATVSVTQPVSISAQPASLTIAAKKAGVNDTAIVEAQPGSLTTSAQTATVSIADVADQVGAVIDLTASVGETQGGGFAVDLESKIVSASEINATMGIDLQLTDVSDTVVEQVKRQSFVMGDPG